MPPPPLSPPSSSTSGSTTKKRVAFEQGPKAPSSTSSGTSHVSLQQRLMHALQRTASSPATSVQDAFVQQRRFRSSVPPTGVPRGVRRPPALTRSQTVPGGTSRPAPWPLAYDDEVHLETFKDRVRQFDRTAAEPAGASLVEAARAQTLAHILEYQDYLRERMAQVSEDLQDFKQRNADLLPTVIDGATARRWAELNSSGVLIKGGSSSPFNEPDVIAFLTAQTAREETLDHIIGEKIADIRRSHKDVLSPVRCRELLVLRAHKELVEKDYIQFYLEMTMLTRCQVAAMRERRRLAEQRTP